MIWEFFKAYKQKDLTMTPGKLISDKRRRGLKLMQRCRLGDKERFWP